MLPPAPARQRKRLCFTARRLSHITLQKLYVHSNTLSTSSHVRGCRSEFRRRSAEYHYPSHTRSPSFGRSSTTFPCPWPGSPICFRSTIRLKAWIQWPRCNTLPQEVSPSLPTFSHVKGNANTTYPTTTIATPPAYASPTAARASPHHCLFSREGEAQGYILNSLPRSNVNANPVRARFARQPSASPARSTVRGGVRCSASG